MRHLRYFASLAREKHFARAARACNVSQPTLSGAIAALELEFGVRLVVRGRRFVDLTSEGRLVLDRAHRLLAGEEELRHDLEKLRGGLAGTLRLGVIPAAMPVVGSITAAFCAVHPGVTVAIHSVSSAAIQAGLDAFELDAGLTYLDNEPLAHVRRLRLYDEHYLLATPRAGPMGERRQVGWREAATLRLCLLSDDMQHRRIVDAVFAGLAAAVLPDVVSNSFLGLLSHLRTGRWSSIVPDSFAHLFGEQPDIALVPLTSPDHVQPVGLVTTDREPPPPMARALAAAARGLDLSHVVA